MAIGLSPALAWDEVEKSVGSGLETDRPGVLEEVEVEG